MNAWLIIGLVLLVITIIGILGMIFSDENYGFIAIGGFILMLIEVGIYLWYRAIAYIVDMANDVPNKLDIIEVIGFIVILSTIFGGGARVSSSK